MARSKLERIDLRANREELDALRRLLGALSRSRAVRIAVRDWIFVEKVIRAHKGIQAAGEIEDVYGRTRRGGER